VIVRGDPDVSASIEPFLARVAQTAAWAGPRADPSRPAACLRGEYTQPRRLEADYFAAVGTAVSARTQGGVRVEPAPELAGQGRLMVYFPDLDLCDGAAEVMTDGWFDVFNCPPWDTWVGFYRDDRPAGDSTASYLVAWVPPAFIDVAGRGMDANPEQCIAWLDETDCGLRRRLADAPSPPGFLARLFRRG
jgi:hypothetical protein